jgi:large subunit ribosomal protein L22
MTRYKYAFKANNQTTVKTVGRDLSLSPKQAVEICKFVKGMHVSKAKEVLGKVKEKKIAIPFTRATNGAGHKKGRMGAGKYPLKGSIEFLKLVKQLEANAQTKGLSSNLTIIHACSQMASEPFRQGRKGRVKMKRCHVELAAVESAEKKEQRAAPARAKGKSVNEKSLVSGSKDTQAGQEADSQVKNANNA